MVDVDVAVIGGGPGGAATAMQCAAAGLRVTLVERCVFPRAAPGETLHPGVLPLLRTLGVEQQVLAAGFLRHEGHFVQWDGPPRFLPFGSDAAGPWRGLQAWRPKFDALLLDRVRQLGVRILQPCRVVRALLENGCVAGVATSEGPIRATFVVDASGRRRWLARQLGLEMTGCGPPLIAWYGHVEGRCPARDEAPALVADGTGWTWTARVRPEVYQWTRLAFDNRRPEENWLPQELHGLARCGRTCGADVSWRAATAPAGPGYFLVGDAASVLDPASSHGVLKALMSGMMAGHAIRQIVHQEQPEQVVQRAYCAWLQRWFAHDVGHLKALYGSLPNPPAWPTIGDQKVYAKNRSGKETDHDPQSAV